VTAPTPDTKDLTTVLCTLLDQISGLKASVDALAGANAKLAEAIQSKAAPAAAPETQKTPAAPPAEPPKPKQIPWQERVRLWLATPEAAKRLKDRTLSTAVIGNQIKHSFNAGERKVLGRILADEGLIRVASSDGDYYIKDPL